MTYKCSTTSNHPSNIILFGLVVPIRRSAPGDLDLYCTAEDEHGNTYNVYTDYDPCLKASHTIAVMKGE